MPPVAHDTLADRAPFEMAASFQETIGGNPFDNQNRHGYAIVEDHPESEALASLIEAHSAYDHHKARDVRDRGGGMRLSDGSAARDRAAS